VFLLEKHNVDWNACEAGQNYYGSIGIVVPDTSQEGALYDRHPSYLGLVSDADQLRDIQGCPIFRIKELEFLPLFEDGSFPARQLEIASEELEKLNKMAGLGCLHASAGVGYDITRSVQRQLMESSDESGSSLFWNHCCYDEVVAKLAVSAQASEPWFARMFWRVTVASITEIPVKGSQMFLITRVSQDLTSTQGAEIIIHDASPFAEVELILTQLPHVVSFVFAQ
jgi:hypothetical protein